MKPELVWLAWAVVLTFVQMLVAVLGATAQVGLPALAGNREGLPPITGWADRAARAHRNMLVSRVLFAALVLAAVVANKTKHSPAAHAGMVRLGGRPILIFVQLF